MSQSSLVVLHEGRKEVDDGEIFDHVVLSSDKLKLIASSAATSAKNPSLTSPVSIDMPFSDLRDEKTKTE